MHDMMSDRLLTHSDLVDHLPECEQSMTFMVTTKGSEEAESHTLPLFTAHHTAESEGVQGAVLSVGGPVWSMDWLPVGGERTEHFVALAAYRELDEVSHTYVFVGTVGLVLNV